MCLMRAADADKSRHVALDAFGFVRSGARFDLAGCISGVEATAGYGPRRLRMRVLMLA